MEKYWHCFQVSDYKGGELHSEINLSVDELLSYISDGFLDNYDSDDLNILSANATNKELVEIFNTWYDTECSMNDTYAGYSGHTTYDIYYSTSKGYLDIGFPKEEEIADFVRNLILEII